MAPCSAYKGTEQGDYSFEKGVLRFGFTLKANDVLAVTRTFLGITFSQKFYAVIYKIHSEISIRLHKNGTADADGALRIEEGLHVV